MTCEILERLGPVKWEPSCVIPDEPSMVTRHSWEPMPASERAQWERDRYERHIAAVRRRA